MRPSQTFEQPSDLLPIFSSEEWVGQQEKRYNEAGVTPASIEAHLEHILSIPLEERNLLQNDDSFYLNSSDPLPDLVNALDVRGKRILSVAASGDFAQIFFFGGAESVELFDISPFAALWTELRMTAAALLSYDEYKRFFTDRLTIRASTDFYELTSLPLFDIHLYQKICPRLTLHARTLFDLLITPPFKELFIIQRINDAEYGFARPRNLHFVHDILDVSSYQTMQKNLINGRVSIRVEEANEAKRRASSVDVVYLSNIGYTAPETVELTEHFREQGATRVMFTLQPGSVMTLSSSGYWLDIDNNIISPQKSYAEIPDTSRALYINARTSTFVFPEDVFLVHTEQKGLVRVRLLNICQEGLVRAGVSYTMLAELA